jgi:hypothetical protein
MNYSQQIRSELGRYITRRWFFEQCGVRFRLVHVPPSRAPENVDVLLHAHTHRPRNERKEGVLFLNPGCVTRPDRGAPPSVATLEIAADGEPTWHLTMLR